MPRFLIVGAGGSGKSTLSRLLSTKYGIPYYDTDSMYWRAGWKLASDEEVIAELPLTESDWVIDGNFIQHRGIVWSQADHIVWLHIPAWVVLRRIIRRNCRWWWTKELSWSGNIMPLQIALSGILHTFGQLRRHPQTFPQYFSELTKQKVTVIKSEKEYQQFVESLDSIMDR